MQTNNNENAGISTVLNRWITFAPCLYIFVNYYFQETTTLTTNAINSLSSVYMLLYPFAIQFTFKYFEDRPYGPPGNGLKHGIFIGAVLNAVAGAVRYIGAIPSSFGFFMLFIGQTIAAVGKDVCVCVLLSVEIDNMIV